MISSVLSFAEPLYRPANSNPCWILVNGQKKWCVEFFPQEARERVLSKAELKRIPPVIQHFLDINRITAAEADFFWLKLLTGCRSSELYRLKWSEVYLEERYFELLEHKTKKKTKQKRIVPLSDAAALLIERQPRVTEYVLWNLTGPTEVPGKPRPAGPLNMFRLEYLWRGNWKNRTKGIRDLAGLPDVRLHDLRRTTATISGTSANLNAHLGKAILAGADWSKPGHTSARR